MEPGWRIYLLNGLFLVKIKLGEDVLNSTRQDFSYGAGELGQHQNVSDI